MAPEPENRGIVGILAGPTASGKSSLAIEIARHHSLSIISGDSMQVYRGMEIGTGAVLPEEQQGVPHHLIAVADPSEEWNAARFVAAAREAACAELAQGRRSIIVGGTGMWLQALREGLFEGPGRDEELRAKLRDILSQEGPEGLHARLVRVDPPMAAKLSVRDHVRVLRAIEVFEVSGRTLTDWYEEDARRRAALGRLLPLYVMTRPRRELYDRINRRVDMMLEAGWLEEARRLHAMKLPAHAPAKKALGYRELFRFLEGSVSFEEARAAIKQETRKFAKRQLTWFRGQRDTVIDEEPTAERAEQAFSL